MTNYQRTAAWLKSCGKEPGIDSASLQVGIAQLEAALTDMHTFFQPNAWGSADNKRDAFNNAASVLGIGDPA